MSIKLIHITSAYQKYLDYFYTSHPYVKEVSFAEHYQTLMNDCFAWADFWKKNLEKLKGYQVVEIIANEEIMQKKWAEEYKITYNRENWFWDILKEQIRFYQPDILFIDDFITITPDFVYRLKKEIKSIRLVIGWDGTALNDIVRMSCCDIVLSCVPHIAAYYASRGLASYVLRFGFEATILDKLKAKETNKKYSVSFIGSLFNYGHRERYDFLSYISRKCKVDIFSDTYIRNPFSKEQLISLFLKRNWKQYRKDYYLYKNIHQAVYGVEMYKVLSSSDITLNKHHDLSDNYAGNMRLVEATGVGTCLVTDWKSNISDFFEPDTEVVTYRTFEEAVDKIKNLIKDPKLRTSIALAGQKKTLEQHSFFNRAKEFNNIIEKHL